MNILDRSGTSRTERLRSGLMVWCALILFVLGAWLLVRPLSACDTRRIEKVHNVVSAHEYPVAALGRQPVRLAD